MPIRPFLHPDHQLDPEAVRVLGLAFEMACGALRLKYRDEDNDAAWIVANKLIELAKTGERNPNKLCDDFLAWARTRVSLPDGPLPARYDELSSDGRNGGLR